MKPKTDLIVNSVCLFLLSPMLGMTVAGLVIGVLEGLFLTLAFVCGILASLFFDIDFYSFAPRMKIIKEISYWAIAICGSIGGILWSYFVIKEHWDQFKIHGRGW